jgi:ketosteroid isomerase-like protein
MALNRKLIDRVNEAFSRGDVEAFLECCADDVRWTMVGEGTFEGKESIRRWLQSVESGLPRFGDMEVIEAGDRAVVSGEMTMEEDERKYAFCDIYRLRDGRIIELRSFVVSADGFEEEYEDEDEDEDEDEE